MFVKKLNVTVVLLLAFVWSSYAQNIRVIDNKGTLQTFNPWRLNGNIGITEPVAPAIYGTSTIASSQNFLGTTDGKSLVLGTNNIERFRITALGLVGIGTATPTQALDLIGNFKFSGALMPNNTAGTAAQLLTSAGPGAAPIWTSSTDLTVTNSLLSSSNTLTSTVNGVSNSTNIINTNDLSSAGNSLTTAVNGVSSSTVNIINENTIGLTGATLTTSVNGVTDAVDLTPLLTSATTNNISLAGNTLTTTVNGVTSSTTAVGLVANTSVNNSLTTAVNGVSGTAVNIINTNDLSSAGNSLTTAVNGVSSSTVNIINENKVDINGATLTTNVNGVTDAVDLTPLLTSATTLSTAVVGNTLTTVVNGNTATTSVIVSNTLTATNGQLVSTVNGVANTTPVSVITSADNGLSVTNGNVQLGGTLSTPTTLVTSASNTLAITNLATGVATDNIVVTDAANSALKTVTANTIIKGNVFRYTITATDVTAGYATISIPTPLQNGTTDYFQLVTLESANSQTYTVSNKEVDKFRLNLGAITAGDIVNVMIIK